MSVNMSSATRKKNPVVFRGACYRCGENGHTHVRFTSERPGRLPKAKEVVQVGNEDRLDLGSAIHLTLQGRFRCTGPRIRSRAPSQ